VAHRRELGLRLRTFQMRWLETEPGKYSWSESPSDDAFLKELSELKRQGFTVSMDYTNLFMDHKHLPGYLEGKSLDDAYLLERWEAHLMAILARYGESIDLLSFGLEVDTYFGKHPNEWKSFLAYFRRGVAVARRLRPKIRLSVTLQSSGLDRFWKDLSADCDFLSTTYYAPAALWKVTDLRCPRSRSPALLRAHARPDPPGGGQEEGLPSRGRLSFP